MHQYASITTCPPAAERSITSNHTTNSQVSLMLRWKSPRPTISQALAVAYTNFERPPAARLELALDSVVASVRRAPTRDEERICRSQTTPLPRVACTPP